LFENQTKEEFPMAAKKDDSSPKTEQGRREFLRASSIIAGGLVLSQTVSSAQEQETTCVPLTTKLPDFPFLTDEEVAMLTPRAQQLTKADLITLSRAQTNREELTEEMALSLTAQDLNSIEQAFANYGVGRFEERLVGDSVSCCCTCTPCCSCCASSVVKPVRVL
jgi:hypothetical protein